jgi:hypothetical protein
MRLDAALPRQHHQPRMPVTHLTLADLRNTDRMSEPNVEEIVARMEGQIGDPWHDIDWADLRALIASWRGRGEALKQISEFTRTAYSASGKDDREFPSEEAAIALAILAAEPASGEKEHENVDVRDRISSVSASGEDGYLDGEKRSVAPPPGPPQGEEEA